MNEILNPEEAAQLRCKIADLQKELMELRGHVLSLAKSLEDSLAGNDVAGLDLPVRVEFHIDALRWYATGA